uniref:Late endosomal/lysosomal adaptor and MAPK and MTOR activator 5 n=1 Tax=Globodera pallida TaxID=36090 RepID=A0A183CAP1_GLOPA
MHYYVKHSMRLRHANLPCVIEYGGGDHKTFFPLEVLNVQFLAIAQNGINTEYNPRRFHAIIMRVRCRERTVSALVFRSGRVVLAGVPHPCLSKKMAERVRRRLQHTQSTQLCVEQLRVVNIVGVHTPVVLHMVNAHKKRVIVAALNATFDQKMFPPIVELLLYADEVEWLKAVCFFCESTQA